MGGDSGVWLTVEYGADVPAQDLFAIGSCGTYGGEFSESDVSYYARPPGSGRRVSFDFYAAADDHRCYAGASKQSAASTGATCITAFSMMPSHPGVASPIE